MGILPARKGGGEVAPSAERGGGSWGPRLALGVFVLLVAFGLVLLFVPDLASELDERTGGGDDTTAAAVTVIEAKRTAESRSRTRSTTERRSTPAGANGRDASPSSRSRSRGSRQQATRSTTETSTTTTDRGSPPDAVLERTFDVPAVAVVARTAIVALLAALVAGAVLRLTRADSAGTRQSTPARPADQPPAPPAPPAPPQPAPFSSPPQVARGSPITPDAAEAARASVMDGVPLLREVFAARGEPSVDEVLPDMRVGVRLTETLSKEQPLPVSLFARDAALGLAAFRTELEQRLRRLARDADLQCEPSADAILRNLTEEGLFEPRAAEGFRDLLRLAQRGLHGGAVDPAMAGWVAERGVPLLLSLDLMLPS